MACSLGKYCEQVPEENRWKLDMQLDFEHGGVPTHLGAIADSMDQWKGRVAEVLELSKVDVSAIKTKYPDELNLQTRKALHLWKEKKGLEATYRNLIDVFLKAEKTSCAEAVCRTLTPLHSSNETLAQVNLDIHTGCAIDDEPGKMPLKQTLNKSFGSLKRKVLQILMEEEAKKRIEIRPFIQFVVELVPNREGIQDAKDIITIFEVISRNGWWSCTNYRLLKSIAEEFIKEKTKHLIDSYEKELTHFYATTKRVDLHTDPSIPKVNITIKIGRPIPSETLQTEYVPDLWKAIAKYYNLPLENLAEWSHLVVEGFSISWLIPHQFAMKIRASKGSKAEAFFKECQIIEQVKLNEECLYHYEIPVAASEMITEPMNMTTEFRISNSPGRIRVSHSLVEEDSFVPMELECKKTSTSQDTNLKVGATSSIPSSQPSSSKPLTLKRLTIIKWKDEKGETQKPLRIICTLSPKWREAGRMLGISASQLEVISMKQLKDPSSCCGEIFSMWLDGACSDDYPVTWAGLIELLVDLQLNHVAENLKIALNIE